MDPRRNIFFHYRGPVDSADEFPRDRQLENNLTKTLVNLLDHTSNHAGRAAFLSVLEVHASARALARRFRGNKLELGLQSVPPDAEVAPRRAVLLITGPGTAVTSAEGRFSKERRGRPDAWVRARDGTTLLVEAKLGPKVSKQQIAAHLRAARWPRSVPVIKTTWSEWYNALDMVRSVKNLSALDRFLLDQALEYLEVFGMAPFTGFQARDFDFFIHYEPTYRARLRQKLEQFAESVHRALPPTLRQHYPHIRMGNIHADEERGAWVGILPTGSSTFQHCNFTIEITRDRLEFNAVIRDGRATDARKPIGILSRQLRADPVTFERILSGLGRDYALTVFARTRADGSTPPRRGNDRWRVVATQRLSIVGEEVVRWIRFLINTIPFPGIHVGQHISRGDQLLQDPARLASEAAESFGTLAGVLGFLRDNESQGL